ncbi:MULTISPECIES: hypothetical protein [Bradyrhizobium]|uniref:Uncharacterized protein n=2 Tax=Bradyrhizobium TaxID=374 RepID=A0ABV4FT50_9BRAD|nr:MULTISPECIES: hypothetical protein [Bradyrhizobium]MBP1059659.1 hypothetical protein [Bradyrhizobium japonicum]MBR1294824.1 hypothetical protein [Bradyrhizobium ottawaense]MCS3499641.1 hypothetical protein [Bradyrhizobium japonicum]MCS3933407.1 hypothetical protein [Bradyrhizobium elkanii]MCS3958197.1 hypothetical protein [Bradyrhizobium japonicum]
MKLQQASIGRALEFIKHQQASTGRDLEAVKHEQASTDRDLGGPSNMSRNRPIKRSLR